MQHCNVSICSFLPSYQYPPKSVHPTVGAFHHPSSRFKPSFFFDGLGFFAPGADVCCETKHPHQLPRFIVVVALVHTHTLLLSLGRLRAFDRDALDRLLNQLEVVSIGAVDREADRDALGFGEQTSLRPFLCTIRWIGTGFFPLQAAPWSKHRPSRARTS